MKSVVILTLILIVVKDSQLYQYDNGYSGRPNYNQQDDRRYSINNPDQGLIYSGNQQHPSYPNQNFLPSSGQQGLYPSLNGYNFNDQRLMGPNRNPTNGRLYGTGQQRPIYPHPTSGRNIYRDNTQQGHQGPIYNPRQPFPQIRSYNGTKAMNHTSVNPNTRYQNPPFSQQQYRGNMYRGSNDNQRNYGFGQTHQAQPYRPPTNGYQHVNGYQQHGY